MKRKIIGSIFLLLVLMVSCSTTSVMKDAVVSDSSISLEEKMTYLGHSSLTLTEPKVFHDGAVWEEELYQLLSEAEQYIIATVFLGSECDENQEIFDLLAKKAEQGLKVYLVVDSTGALDMTESRFHLRPLYRLAESGVHFLEFNPFSGNRIPWVGGMVFREHRKFFIVDGYKVALGGMNINYISMNAVSNGGQRDAMYSFISPTLASLMVEDFSTFWNNNSWETIEEGTFLPSNKTDNSEVKAWFVNQDEENLNMSGAFGSLLSSAKEEILMLPFLPTADKTMLSCLREASERGAFVEMILPNDSRENLRNAARFIARDLIDSKVHVRQEINCPETASLLHEKLMIIDKRYVVVGSANLNYRSMNLSSEILLIIDDPSFAEKIRSHYFEIRDFTEEITEEQANQWHDFSNSFNFIVSYFGG